MKMAFQFCILILTFASLGYTLTDVSHADSLEDSQRPNVIVILADDLGYGDLSCYGGNDIQTPAIDKLAAKGIAFTNFYANCPVCSPTRAALLTGCYQERVGVPGVIRTRVENSWGKLSKDASLLPEVLKQSGYSTAIIGKWHLGLQESDWPNRRGFDFFKGFLGDMMDDYYNHRRHGINYMRENENEIDPKGHATDLFSDWAVEYLNRRSRAAGDQPFFLYLAYNAPHTPIQPPADWLEKVRVRHPEMSEKRAKLVALIEHMDAGIGRVMDAVESNGLAENTLIFFTSDNGGQSNVGANNGPHRAGKGTMYEGGLKVPAIGVWPGNIAAQSKTESRFLTMDLFATICEATGSLEPEGIDGFSFLKTLKGKPQPNAAGRDLFFLRREGGQQYNGLAVRALRRGNWKLVQNSPYANWELFNLEKDPLESNDLAKSNLKVFREMCAAMRKQIQIGGKTPWQ